MTPAQREAVFGSNGCVASAASAEGGVQLRVRGVCMQPVLPDGCGVRVRRVALLLPGDVVALYSPEHGRSLMHRFLGYVPSGGKLKLMTMADNGLRPDPLVASAHCLGRVTHLGDDEHQVKPSMRWRSLWRYGRWSLQWFVQRRLLRRRGAAVAE